MTRLTPYEREKRRLTRRLAVIEQFPEEWEKNNKAAQKASLLLFPLLIPVILKMVEAIDAQAYIIMLTIIGTPVVYLAVRVSKEQKRLESLVK